MNKTYFTIGDVVDCLLHDDANIMFVRGITIEKEELILDNAPEGERTTWIYFRDVIGVPLTSCVLQLSGFKPIAGNKGLYEAGNGLRLQLLGNGYCAEDILDELSGPLVMEALHELQHYYALLQEQPLQINGVHRHMPLVELCPDDIATHYYWLPINVATVVSWKM